MFRVQGPSSSSRKKIKTWHEFDVEQKKTKPKNKKKKTKAQSRSKTMNNLKGL